MPTLLEALTEGFDLVGPSKYTGDFVQKLKEYKSKAVRDFVQYGISLDQSIAELAAKSNLNDDQIQRIVEDANTQVYLIKYNEMKTQPERDVIFDLASLNGVKEKMGLSKNPAPIPAQSDTELEGENEKVASWESGGDGLNFMNFDMHGTASLAPDKEVSRDYIELQKTAAMIMSIDRQVEESLGKVADTMYDLAGVFVKYARSGCDVNRLFRTIQKESTLNVNGQTMLKKAIDQRVDIMKEARALPEEYSFPELTGIDKEAELRDEFSLGDKSHKEKTEFDGVSNQELPVVVTDKRVVRSVQDLVNLANQAALEKQKSIEHINNRELAVEASGLTPELVEKIANAESLQAVKFLLKG